MKLTIKEENGQVVVIMVLVMFLALAIGVGVATNFIKNLRITSRTDASSRAFSVAEALVENILSIPYETLYEYVQFGSCGTDCNLEILGDDEILAVADATLSVAGDSPDPYPMSLLTDEIREINLKGYPNDTNTSVCWDDPAMGDPPSVIAQLIYGIDGNYNVDTYAYNSVNSVMSSNGFDSASSSEDYANCFSVSGSSSPISMRLRSVYNDVDVFILPTANESIPAQGILIDAQGVFSDTVKKVQVLKSEPYLPLPFDYAIYQKSTSEPLSN